MAKNKLLVFYIVLGCVVLIIAGGVLAKGIVNKSTKDTISKEEAYSIAAKNAGIDTSKVDYTKCNLKIDDGQYVYDVEFIDNDIKYEYEIDGSTGQILDIEKERIPSIS